MRNSDLFFLSLLIALGAFIWGRDLTWFTSAEEALPMLAALPVFVWLGWPWKFENDPRPISSRKIATASALLLLGIALDLTVLLAAAWTLLLWGWLEAKLQPKPGIKRLLLLPLLAFPWLTLDLPQLGWWFRLSGAWSTEHLFSTLGYSVQREGTNLFLAGHPIAVEAACSGLQTLQSMLVAGTVIASLILDRSNRFWLALPLLLPLAWAANTLRIVILCFATVWKGPEFSMGAFHDWGGFVVLLTMFLLSCGWFSLLRPRSRPLHLTLNQGGNG